MQLVATGVSDEGAAAALHGTEDANGVHAGVFEQGNADPGGGLRIRRDGP